MTLVLLIVFGPMLVFTLGIIIGTHISLLEHEKKP